ncbi:MAG: hypothetical protein AAFO84_02605 [Cyanobacteria bacterium J06598_1]
MSSRLDLATKSRFVLGIGLLSIGLVWLLKLLWPVLILVGISAGLYTFWHHQQKDLRAYERRQARMTEKFYSLLQQHQGRISALEFAMHTRINPHESQRFLHGQAQDFGAFFERTRNGDIIYIFNLAVVYSLQPSYAPEVYPLTTPAEIAWAYAERAHAEKAAQSAHAQSAYAQNAYAQNAYKQKLRLPAGEAPGWQANKPTSDQTLQTVRGRANATPHHIKTIDVSAINE